MDRMTSELLNSGTQGRYKRLDGGAATTPTAGRSASTPHPGRTDGEPRAGKSPLGLSPKHDGSPAVGLTRSEPTSAGRCPTGGAEVFVDSDRGQANLCDVSSRSEPGHSPVVLASVGADRCRRTSAEGRLDGCVADVGLVELTDKTRALVCRDQRLRSAAARILAGQEIQRSSGQQIAGGRTDVVVVGRVIQAVAANTGSPRPGGFRSRSVSARYRSPTVRCLLKRFLHKLRPRSPPSTGQQHTPVAWRTHGRRLAPADPERTNRRPRAKPGSLDLTDSPIDGFRLVHTPIRTGNDYKTIGPASGLSAALHHLLRRDHSEMSSASLSPEGSTIGDSRLSLRSRRMSTPHPIRSRLIQSLYHAPTFQPHLRRAHSSPDFINYDNLTVTAHRKRDIFRVSLSTAGDLAIQSQDYSSDDDSVDSLSFGLLSIGSTLSLRQQIFEAPTYAEALWDHVTMDPEELGFRAGDVIRVTEMRDRNWWFGQIADKEGWFPASFVRLRANQVEIITEDPSILVTPSQKSRESVSQSQARTNVVREIVQAEKEYVKHLKDVIQGYLEKCEKRPEMFPPEKMSSIFSNITDIYNFSVKFSKDLEQNLNVEEPHQSKLGKVFINHRNGFKIYSEYCNNHPTAQNELRILQKNKKYTHFFEACRLLQDMINLPLEGFLLAPVQKICKYPLQLRELLKYTPQTHEDYEDIKAALDTMHGIAVMINERKRKMESIEKLAQWQLTVEDWQGPDLLDKSSELIYSGEMTKVNSYGIRQDRMFFLFDHQLIYCKKELLWRDMLVYKGRIDLDNCVIKVIPDERDQIFNISVKNAIRIYDNTKAKWYLMYCRSVEERRRWFNAFQQERDRVEEDKRNGFNLAEFRSKARLPEDKGTVKAHTARYREHGRKAKKKHHVDQTKSGDRQPFFTSDEVTTPDMTEDTQRRWAPIFRKAKR